MRIFDSAVAPVLMLRSRTPIDFDVRALPLGTYVFSADGEEVGSVAEIAAPRFAVKDRAQRLHWLGVEDVQELTAGRLLLADDTRDLAALWATEHVTG